MKNTSIYGNYGFLFSVLESLNDDISNSTTATY